MVRTIRVTTVTTNQHVAERVGTCLGIYEREREGAKLGSIKKPRAKLSSIKMESECLAQ